MRCVFVNLGAYLVAAFIGAIALTITTFFFALFSNGNLIGKELILVLQIGFLYAVLLGWIGALPIAILAEIRFQFGSKWPSDWRVYVGAGGILGLSLWVMFLGRVPSILAILIPSAMLAGLGYWFFAWRLVPPAQTKAKGQEVGTEFP